MFRDHRISRSTGTADIAIAREKAWNIYLDETGASTGPQMAQLRSTAPLLSEITQIYTSRISEFGKCSRASAHTNVNSLNRIVAAVCGARDVRLDRNVLLDYRRAYGENQTMFSEAAV